MIQDFADTALILRNKANTRDDPSRAAAFDAELVKHHAMSELRQKLSRSECTWIASSAPADRVGVTFGRYGHIRSMTFTVLGEPWGPSKLADIERIEILDLNGQVLGAVEIIPSVDEVKIYGTESEPVAQIESFDDPADISFEWFDEAHPNWRGNYINGTPGFEYIDKNLGLTIQNRGAITSATRVYVEADQVVVSMTTPFGNQMAIHRVALDINQNESRISHRAEWQVADEIPYSHAPDNKLAC